MRHDPVSIRTLAALLAAGLLAGCGAALAPLANVALSAAGIGRQEVPESQKPPRTVPLTLHAAPRLNVDARGQPLALAVRLYKLRQKDAFEQTPYAAFLDPRLERESLGADLVEVREIMLVPGQRYEVREKVAREAGHIGIVALFHTPAPERWRAAFSSADAERDGLDIGLYACAMGAGASTAGIAAVRCR